MQLGKSKIFLLFCLSFLLGVFSGPYLNYYVMAATAMIFIILLTLAWQNKRVLLIACLVLTLLAGAVRLKTSSPVNRPDFVGRLFGQKVELTGVVVKEPDVRDKQTNLTMRVEGYTGAVLLNVSKYPEYQYGDKLQFTGKLEEPFETPDFSYKNYLARFDTYAVVRFPKIEKLAVKQGNPVKAFLLSIKRKFVEVLSASLPEPHSALALGLILGLKRALPQDFQAALVLAGVSHIVVISGYNISVITRNLLKTRAWWGKRVAFWLSLATVLAFVILTGADASVVRAAVMGMLVVLALNLGRLYQSLNALIFVAAIMVLANPKILSHDIGFQLSFLATLGLIYLSPMFEKWFARVPDVLGFRTNLSSTLAAQIFTLPILIYYFDRISIVAPVVNVLILWTIPYTMLLAFVAGLAGIVYLPLGHLVASLPWVFLEFQIRVIQFFAHLPFAALSLQMHWWALPIYYLLILLGVWLYRYYKNFHYYLEYARIKV
jgi:competence protein ComEC